MAPVVTIQLVFLLLSVLQIQTSADTPNGFLLYLCPESQCPSSTASCPTRGPTPTKRNDYTYIPGVGAYKVHKIGRNWNDARSYCEDQGAHLIIINSIAKMEAIAKLIKNSQITAGWIGAHDLYKEGQFVTIHGESLPTGFPGWVSGKPDNAGGDENCVIVATSGSLDDRRCTRIYPFTCELHL